MRPPADTLLRHARDAKFSSLSPVAEQRAIIHLSPVYYTAYAIRLRGEVIELQQKYRCSGNMA
jgi:hypothetical protein